MSNVYTAIADIINPEVLGDQVSAKFPDHLVIGNSGLVKVDGEFPLGSPGTRFKMPFWKRITTVGDLAEGTAMETNKIQTGAENATVVRGGVAFEVYDTATLVSKSDPVSEIADQLARRFAEYIDAKLTSQLELSPNVFDQALGAAKTNVNGTMDQNAIIAALVSTLGDNHQSLVSGGAIIMHSKPYGDLLQTGAVQNNYQSGLDVIKTGRLATILGMPIIVSDRVTTATVSGVLQYHTYVVGPEALALFYQRQVNIEFDRDILLQADVIAGTVHFAPHLFGYDDVTAAVVAEQNKSIRAVVIKSK